MLFFLGIFVIALAVSYICTGKAYARLHGWVYRADDPIGYWCEVALCFVFGAGLIAYSLYKNWFSN
jgi:hypothetical protein